MLSFDRDNDPNSVMGKRWLSKGDSLLISGPTGIGKSSFAMQMVVTWCLGRRFFSIPIERPQRALIIQSENNLGDLAITFQDCIKRMGISNDEIGRLKEDLIFLRESSLAGDAFTAELRRWILQFKPDVVLIDPLFSYIGADASKQEVMTHFLRNRLQPIIDETQVILVIIHHTGKPPKDAVNSPNEGFAARSFGSVELINWAREIVTFIPRHWDRRIFSLEFRKRARQAAITDLQGRPAYELFLKHSADGIIWEVCDESDIESVRDNRAGRPSKRESNCDLALRVLAKAEPTGMSSKEWMNACDLPETTFGRTKKDLVNRGIVYLSKTDGTYQLTASALEAAKVGR